MKHLTKLILVLFISASFQQNLYKANPAFAFSVGEEKEVGEQLLTMVRKGFTLIDEPDVIQYINELGQGTLAVAGSQYFDYHFFVIKNKELNAFAAPSGLIFFHSGLVESLDSEEELGTKSFQKTEPVDDDDDDGDDSDGGDDSDERQPPDQIVEHDDRPESPRQFAIDRRDRESDRAERLAEQADNAPLAEQLDVPLELQRREQRLAVLRQIDQDLVQPRLPLRPRHMGGGVVEDSAVPEHVRR